MTVDAAALDDVLASLEVQLGRVHRVALAPGDLLPLAPGSSTLAYVVAGELTGDATDGPACTVDLPAATPTTTPSGAAWTLAAGDALLDLGHRARVLESPVGAELITAAIDLRWPAAARGLPSFTRVTGFARLEPAAAALAAQLGSPAPLAQPSGTAVCTAGAAAPGDSLICRMMVTTVVLSLVRAWAHAGCAPSGWPRREEGDDPFLTRAAAAVLDDPGRDWTVEQLAAMAAMSRSVFAERFRAAFGRSPAGFVTEVRMHRAMRLLDAGRAVSETSRALGYGSDEGFSRAFRRHTGALPSQWRSRQRAAGAGGAGATAVAALSAARFDLANSTAPTSSATTASA